MNNTNKDNTKLYKITCTLITPLTNNQFTALKQNLSDRTNPLAPRGALYTGLVGQEFSTLEFTALHNGVDFLNGKGTRISIEEIPDPLKVSSEGLEVTQPVVFPLALLNLRGRDLEFHCGTAELVDALKEKEAGND